jgi:hypothetical protein
MSLKTLGKQKGKNGIEKEYWGQALTAWKNKEELGSGLDIGQVLLGMKDEKLG